MSPILDPTVRAIGFFVLLGFVGILILAIVFRPNFRKDILGSQGEAKVFWFFTTKGAGFFTLIALLLGGAIFLAIPVGMEPPVVEKVPDTADKTPEISGRAAPGAEVEIFDKGVRIGGTKADPSGTWRFLPSQPLSVGTHKITAKTRADGQASAKSKETVFRVLSAGIRPRTLSRVPPPRILVPAANSTSRVTRVSGTAASGAQVVVNIDARDQAPVRADSGGRWLLLVRSGLRPGRHEIKAKTVTSSGTSAYSPGVTVTVPDSR